MNQYDRDKNAILTVLEQHDGRTTTQQIKLQAGEFEPGTFTRMWQQKLIRREETEGVEFWVINLSPELVAHKFGLDLEDATKVLEGSCVTNLEFISNPDDAWTRMRGAAEELCDHEFHSAVDDDGEVIEPPYDLCIHCGDRRD